MPQPTMSHAQEGGSYLEVSLVGLKEPQEGDFGIRHPRKKQLLNPERDAEGLVNAVSPPSRAGDFCGAQTLQGLRSTSETVRGWNSHSQGLCPAQNHRHPATSLQVKLTAGM